MLKPTLEKALNNQLNYEVYSAYIYWSMSAHLESMALPGFANWMRIQAQEEMTHAMKFYQFLVERNGRVLLDAIPKPQNEWPTVQDIFAEALKHEQTVTSRINDLVDLSLAEKDHASHAFLQWFVNEQVEEESTADDIIQQLKLTEDSKGALFILDKEMATRVFTPPTQGESL